MLNQCASIFQRANIYVTILSGWVLNPRSINSCEETGYSYSLSLLWQEL
jgi:hypothetical protein